MKLILKNIVIFSITTLLFFLFAPLEKNNDYFNTVFYDHEGFNQYGLDRQSMEFIDNGYFPTIDRKELYSLYQNEETIYILKSIAKAYNFHNKYLNNFIRQHQTCVFNNENINCFIYLKDKDFDELKYQANLECEIGSNCKLTDFTHIVNTDSKRRYYCKSDKIDSCIIDYSFVDQTIKSVFENFKNIKEKQEGSSCMENFHFDAESNMCISYSDNSKILYN